MASEMNRGCSNTGLYETCRQSIEHLSRACDMPRAAFEKEVRRASLVLVNLRDCLIERLRSDAPKTASQWRQPLDQVNRAISFVAGVEFPSSGLHRNYLDEARKTLESVREHLPE